MYRPQYFNKFPKINVVVSDKSDPALCFDGALNNKKIFNNRNKFFKKNGINLQNSVFMEQIHGKKIYCAVNSDKGRGARSSTSFIKKTDGMATKYTNICLVVKTADCIPIVFYDPIKKIIGCIHAGWQGIAKGIASEFVKKVIKSYNCKRKNMIFWLGPSIRECCYEVSKAKDNRAYYFEKKYGKKAIHKQKDKIYLNLQYILKKQLIARGVNKKNIFDEDLCTGCLEKRFYSYYKRKNEKGLRMLIAVERK